MLSVCSFQQGGCKLRSMPRFEWLRLGVGTLGAGVFSSFLMVCWIVQEIRLAWSVSDLLLLFLALMLSGFLLALVPAIVFRRCVQPFWAGILAILVVYGGEWWFRAPPPHIVNETWRGSLWMGGVLLGVVVGLGWATRYFWVRRAGWCVGAGLLVWGVPFDWMGNDHELVSSGPNVLLISVDTWRADHVGARSDGVSFTPVFDRLATTGALFEHAYAPIAVTGPSHAAMLTGMGPWRTRMLLNGVDVPEEYPLLSQHLSEKGYRTGAFVSAYVLDGQLGFQRGFEVYDDEFARLRGWSRSGPGRIQAMVERFLSPSHVVERRGDETVDRALEWWKMASDRPTFLWVHLFDPHGPYTPPSPFDQMYYSGDPRASEHNSMETVTGIAEYLQPSLDGIRDVEWVRAQYAGEVSFVDQQMDRLVQHLESEGSLEDTLVVIVGDHGESLGENEVWFNHGGDLDVSALHVPFLVHWPKVIEGGVRFEETVGVVDVAPTILGLLSMDKTQTDGVDRSGQLQGMTTLPHTPVQSICYDRTVNQTERARGNITKPTHLLARTWTKDGWVQIGTHPSRGAIQRGQVDAEVIRNLSTVLGSVGVGIHERASKRDSDTLQRLRSLGYVE